MSFAGSRSQFSDSHGLAEVSQPEELLQIQAES